MKQVYTGKLGARDFKENQRELYIRRFHLRQTDGMFIILFDGKEFIRVSKIHPMPFTFPFKIALAAWLLCVGTKTQVWDELAVDPMKDAGLMQSVPRGRGVIMPPKGKRAVNENAPAQTDLEELLQVGHA